MNNFLINSSISDSLKSEINSLWSEYEECLKNLKSSTNDIEIIHNIKPKAIGKEGIINKMFALMKDFSGDDKKEFSKIINLLKSDFEKECENKLIKIEEIKQNEKMKLEEIDPTIPANGINSGTLHVISKASTDIIKILNKIGFNLFDGPEIDTTENNFTKLNIPENHPARQMQDTFYIKSENGDRILRTHTSNVQIHAMTASKPPIRGISFGKVYRFESDATHSPMFHQIEAFCVDKDINLQHLMFTIEFLLKEFFETDLNFRVRPSFFPFTTPSYEIDISYIKENGEIKIAKSEEYIEIGGCGLIHDNVLNNCNINPNEFSGFALGFGVDRMAMLKYNLSDIRKFYKTSSTWIKNNNIKFFDL
jgi:phenylalanyl-tRNA synthetase alpha chain